jgi:hypothetical protein
MAPSYGSSSLSNRQKNRLRAESNPTYFAKSIYRHSKIWLWGVSNGCARNECRIAVSTKAPEQQSPTQRERPSAEYPRCVVSPFRNPRWHNKHVVTCLRSRCEAVGVNRIVIGARYIRLQLDRIVAYSYEVRPDLCRPLTLTAITLKPQRPRSMSVMAMLRQLTGDYCAKSFRTDVAQSLICSSERPID